MTNLSRTLWVVAGSVFVLLGLLGVLLPLLPTTPFMLLAAVCYAKGSKRFHDGLLANRFLGAYIRNYREGRGMTLAHKAVTLTFLWVSIGYAALFVASLLWVRLVLLLVAGGVTRHLASLPTHRV
ncbi:MAG: YbaN family protein [Anaerolineae bacterium]